MNCRRPRACHEIDARVSGLRTDRAARRLAPWTVLLVLGCGTVSAADDVADGGAGTDAGMEVDARDPAGNHAPTDIRLSSSTLEEQALPGTAVGVLTATDPDAGDAHTFELVADAGGLFVLVGDQLQVATGAVPNYEATPIATITVRATDSSGASLEMDLDVALLDLLEVETTADSGPGSLRQTIADAPAGATILFETGLGPVLPLDSQIVLDKAVVIRGPRAPAEIVLDGLDGSRVFRVAAGIDVTLERFRLRRGRATGGGAILNDGGTLRVDHCTIQDSSAGTGAGGGIHNNSDGVLTVRDTTFTGNDATLGGAIDAWSAAGTTIERCTFDGNQASYSGGAIRGGGFHVVNTTFSDNRASNGGAIAADATDLFGVAEIAFSTFGGNSATNGGAILVGGEAGHLILRASILSGNSAPNGPDLRFDVDNIGEGDHNVIAVPPNYWFSDGVNGNLIGTTVTLAALADNGGATRTRMPASGAVSVDLVPAARCDGLDGALGEDQRAIPRPSGDACDAGAVER
jgi:predicted outer membrane repeat protein